MVNAFIKWLSSPLADWHTMQLMDRLLVGAAGVGVGYYLYKKHPKMPKWHMAGYSLGAAYLAAMLINAARKFEAPQAVLPTAPPPPPPIQTGPEPTVESDQSIPVDDIPDEIMDEDDGDLEGIFD